MAGDSSPTQPPPAKLQKKLNPTSIDSLDEDILREIFLRLTSLATLIRAACTCCAWRGAVASSPTFRRRFRALHPAPVLGFFFEFPQPAQFPDVPAFPAFVPARRRDRDLVAAVRSGDFFLTSIQERPKFPCWEIVDCRGGYVLMNWYEGLLTLFNPLLWWSETFDLMPKGTFEGHCDFYAQLNVRLLFSDEDPMSFRVVLLAYDRFRVRATVFSSDTWEWSVLPWVDVPAMPTSKNFGIQRDCGMQANGFLYWVYKNHEYMITLDTVTMEFSVAELPRYPKNPGCSSFVVGETKDLSPCIVYAFRCRIGVLLRGTDDDGAEMWVRDRVVSLDARLQQVAGDVPDELNVVAVMDGFAYLTTMYHDPKTVCWFLSLCLETMELEKLLRTTFDSRVHPYVMAWPPSLVGNYGGFAQDDAP